MISEIIADLLQIRGCSGGPADAHSGAQHLFEAGVHFLIFNELAPIRLGDAFPHGCPEASVFVQETQRSILYQPLGVSAGGGGNLRELGFLLWGERDFHEIRIGKGVPCGKLSWRSQRTPVQ
jgi:hypothetical protein